MTTHADGFFAIGSTHGVCQDYVRTGTTPDGRAYAIVSDGCSSSKDTDIGARLLVRAAENFIRNNIPISIPAIIAQARAYAATMSLMPTCLDATLLLAYEQGEFIELYLVGDGVVAARPRNGGEPFIFQMEYPGGAPFYPNYFMDPPRLQAFLEMPDNLLVTKPENLNLPGVFCIHQPHERDTVLCLTLAKAEFDLVVLSTDGITSFRNSDMTPIPVTDLVTQLLAVKIPTGAFLTRRCKRFLGTYAGRCQTHFDDFSAGALFIDESPKEEDEEPVP